MCDRKCGGGSKKEKKNAGPPENLPIWLQCPPKLKERSYPAPSGVEILPLSIGGRNGGSGGKKLSCGQCGSTKDEQRKPNASADCPMMKARCPGVMDDAKSKVAEKAGGGGGVMAKISSFFGKEDSKLVELCKKLHVPDEQIRHHRDVFDPHLICRKDGYFSPFMTRVDCEGVDDECEEEVVDDEDCEEEEEYEEDCEEEEDEEEDETIEEDGCNCPCECPDEEERREEEEEEECVEDAEGECIIEESAECMDENCKFFLDGPAQRDCKIDEKIEGEDFGQIGTTPEQEEKNKCKAMSNFIIRVQAPFSDCSTNETCEQILERLTNKSRQTYPEPEAKPGKEEVEIIVKQISVEDPSCEPTPKPKKKCKKKDDSTPKHPSAPSQQEPCAPPPPPPSPKPESSIPTPPSEPPKDPCPPSKESVSDSPPPAGVCPQPEGVQCPPPPNSEDSSPPNPEAKEEPKQEEPPPPPQNDCDTLNEAELLKKRLRDIRCGCRTVCPPIGSLPEREIPVWTPPPPPPCSRCGAKVRGDTEDCFLCNLTRRMRSGDFEEGCPPLSKNDGFDAKQLLNAFKPDPSTCTPEYLPDGSVKYKGGMCLEIVGTFLWHTSKKVLPGGFFDKFTGNCGVEERLKALTGSSDVLGAFAKDEAERPSYAGGMSIRKCCDFLWAKATETENKPPPPQCKK